MPCMEKIYNVRCCQKILLYLVLPALNSLCFVILLVQILEGHDLATPDTFYVKSKQKSIELHAG